MTLYHYVASKAELTALMLDAIMAEQLVPVADLPTNDGGPRWPSSPTAPARCCAGTAGCWAACRLRAAARAGRTRSATLRDTGGCRVDRPGTRSQRDIIAAVDDYVAGFVLKTDLEPGLESIPDEAAPEVAEYLDRELRTGDYPHIAALLGEGDSWVALRASAPPTTQTAGSNRAYVGSSTASPPK